MTAKLTRPRFPTGLWALGSAILLTACEDPAVRKERAAQAARARVSAESTIAIGVATTTPAAGAWTDALVAKRMVDAGLAPQRKDSVAAKPWMNVPVHAWTLGAATVHAYIYKDSTARKAAVAGLDPATLGPRGQPSPWSGFRAFVENGNLAAIIDGGTDRQRDRIVTALAAGIGAP
jgi:hypothetical protein